MGIGGVQGSQRGGQMTNAIDSGIVSFVGSGNFGGQGDNIWHRKTVQLTRNSGASTGRIRLWIDSKLVGTVTAATIGANTTTDTYTPRKGEVFTQATPAGTLTVFIADSQDSNGYREPLDS